MQHARTSSIGAGRQVRKRCPPGPSISNPVAAWPAISRAGALDHPIMSMSDCWSLFIAWRHCVSSAPGVARASLPECAARPRLRCRPGRPCKRTRPRYFSRQLNTTRASQAMKLPSLQFRCVTTNSTDARSGMSGSVARIASIARQMRRMLAEVEMTISIKVVPALSGRMRWIAHSTPCASSAT